MMRETANPAIPSIGMPIATRPARTGQRKSDRIDRKFFALVALAILIWGANWPVMKFGGHYIPPLWFAASRFLSASVLSFGIATVMGKLRFPRRDEWAVVIGVGVLQMGMFTALVTIALHFVMPGRASLIAYATSIWVVPGAAIVLKQRLSAQQTLATICSYAGIAIVVAPSLLHSDAHGMIGYLLLGAASLSWAVNILQIKSTPNVKLDFDLLPWQTLIAALPLCIAAMVFEGAPTFLGDRHSWYVIAYTGPLATALTFMIVLQMTQRLSPVTVSVCMLGVPLVGITMSAAIFGERLSGDLLLGLAFICIGMLAPAMPGRHRYSRGVQ